MVPLVNCLVDVQSFIALQAYQLGAQSGGQGAGDLGLADPGLPLQEQRPLQLHSQEYGNCQGPVGDVDLISEQVLHFFDGLGRFVLNGRQWGHRLSGE